MLGSEGHSEIGEGVDCELSGREGYIKDSADSRSESDA